MLQPIHSFAVTVLLAVLLMPMTAIAELRLAGVFGDQMVLQQGAKLPIWGTATPGQQITVTIAGHRATTTTNTDGRWRAELDPIPSSSDAVPFTVSATAGGEGIELHDVLVGDVWLASGQSNMQFSLKQSEGGNDAISKADRPTIRLCMVGNKPSLQPLHDRQLSWLPCTPQSAGKFSAVAYYFATELQQSTKTPIGVIGSYVSGTPAQSWTNAEALASEPQLEHYLRERSAPATTTATTKPTADAGPGAGVPTSLYNGMIAPLIPLRIKGVIWYQGESNAGRHEEYRTLFPALIRGWRSQWGQGDFPFLFVQLPGFGRRQEEVEPGDWPWLRDAQAQTLSLPNTAMAVTIDLSEPRALLHPKNKFEVGSRLALLARRVAYGQDVPAVGPVFDSMTVEGQRVRLHFRNADDGLIAKAAESTTTKAASARQQLEGFLIAGADRRFLRADAQIDGRTVVVWNESVNNPVAVRYAWEQNPAANLYNTHGLPAAPFRTDDWPP
jgi:sialate O-acetylesterase